MQPVEKTENSRLSPREEDILRSIVNLYAERGEAIGSQLLSDRVGDLSSATVRNIFARIEERGLIRKAHCSAGRIPTDAGLRYFVDHILKVRRIAEGDRRLIDERTEPVRGDVPSLLAAIPDALSEVSRYTGFVLSKRTRPAAIRHIDLVPVAPRRVLVILVDAIGGIANRVIELPEDVPAAELERLRNFINAHLVDRTLLEIRGHFLGELRSLQERYEQVLDRIIAASPESVRTHTSGETNAFDYIGSADLRHLKRIMDDFRHTRLYLDLFSRIASSRDVHIFIGAESDLFCIPECAVILSSYDLQGGDVVGVVGVIGPRRMNYGKMISIVDYTRHLLTARGADEEER
ncbi:MAG TPA: heat-inducible transcriptional repressor HrcA [bacterium]|nr:heat-inducible transcriptional repressor HrcA [bacterium]